MLKVWKSFSSNFQKVFLENCPKEFIRFLCECIVNLVDGHLDIKKNQVVKYQHMVKRLGQRTVTLKERRKILSSNKGIRLLTLLFEPILKRLD